MIAGVIRSFGGKLCWEIWSPVSNGFTGGYDQLSVAESQPIDEIAQDLINYKWWCQRGYGWYCQLCQRGYGHCCLNDIHDGWWSTMSSSGQLCWWHRMLSNGVWGYEADIMKISRRHWIGLAMKMTADWDFQVICGFAACVLKFAM